MMEQRKCVQVGISPREGGKTAHTYSHLLSVLVASGPLKIFWFLSHIPKGQLWDLCEWGQ